MDVKIQNQSLNFFSINSGIFNCFKYSLFRIHIRKTLYKLSLSVEILNKVMKTKIMIKSNIPVLDNLDNYFNFNNVEINDILFSLKQINKSHSNDIYVLNYNCFKTIILYNTQYFVNFINMSFKEGRFPGILKNSKLVPILKNESYKEDLNNFGPITITPIFSKIIEKLAHNQIYNFLDKNKLINQYGFLKNKSTNSCLDMYKYNIVKNLELKNFYISIFFDLS